MASDPSDTHLQLHYFISKNTSLQKISFKINF